MRGRDIQCYSYEFADLYLLFIPWHFPLHKNSNISGASLEAEQAFENQYPAIYQHLLQHKEQLCNRNKSETGIRYEWYALQRWGANYWEDFSRQKIIFQEMVQKSSFILDTEGKYMCLDTARIITGKDLDIIISILNSDLFFYSIKTFYGGGGLGETGVRMKHTYFENFPMPTFTSEEILVIRRSLEKIDKIDLEKINNIIYQSFGLEKEEIDFINLQ